MSSSRRNRPLGILDEQAPFNKLDRLDGCPKLVPPHLFLATACVLRLEGSSRITGCDVGAWPRCAIEQVAVVRIDSTQLDGETLLRLSSTPL
jgi:hypothetical protein